MTAIAHHPHRVSRVVAGVRDQLSAVAEVPLWSMDAVETTATIEEVLAAEAQLAEVKAKLLTHAETIDVPGQTGATSTAKWLAPQTKLTHAAAHRATRLATALEAHEQTRRALAAGRLHVEQAEVILRGLDDLPANLDPALFDQAEAHLLELARHHDAKDLKNLARRLLEVIDPDAADAHEARLLEREERDAQAACRITLWDDGHGKLHGRFTLPSAIEGAAFKKALLALAAPKHQAATTGPLGERKPSPERMGRAFAELITRYPTKRLPKAGGLNATVVVLMPLDTLLGGLKAAHLDTGQTISPSLARKLACEAGIIPAVLDGNSQVLDLGRKKRFHNQAQRIAATINQRGTCIVEDCEATAGHAHMHHPTAWSAGGETNRDGMLICAPHHTRIHDTRYWYTQLPSGRISFHRRT